MFSDSFCYHIETDSNTYKDIKGNQWYFFSSRDVTLAQSTTIKIWSQSNMCDIVASGQIEKMRGSPGQKT